VQTEPLCARECRALFALFAKSHANPLQPLDGPALAALKKLPIFETRAGSFVALALTQQQREAGAREQECFICPPSVTLEAPSEQLLLYQERELYRALGVTELDDTALFERFVLPRFAMLSLPQQVSMLTFAGVCWRKLAYADVCWPMLVYAAACCRWRSRCRSRRVC
jgi:hypothetical protein